MKTLEKWDKVSSINGVLAERVLNSNPSYANAEIYLIKNNNRVERIENVSIIRSNTGYEGTDEEVMQQYVDKINADITAEADAAKASEYECLVLAEIRKKYTLDQELSVQRQRDTKPEEFQEYFEYCEECKEKVKEALNV